MYSQRISVVACLLVAGCSGATPTSPRGESIKIPSAAGSGKLAVVRPPPVSSPTAPPVLGPDQDPIPTTDCVPAAAGYSDAEVMKLVDADAAKLPADARSQTLYVSLAHLAEDRTECDMRFFRFGVGQLANMMSWSKDILAPAFIDPNDYVARVDVRALDWEADALPYMMATAKRGDYGILSSGEGKPAVVRGDWLAQQMTRPPVYGYIMRNQLFERQMEEQSGVDNSKPGRFGGVYQSIVAQNPRILERRESEYGSCWISHDFLYRTQATEALETGELPPDDLRFGLQEYIAREYICTLPNGMQLFQVTGFVSQRRWDANTCLAQNGTREDKRVLNGQCFNCHTDGWIRFEDEVRGGKSNPSQHILDNFPAQAELDGLFDEDQARWTNAISQIPYYDPNYATPLNEMIRVYSQRSGDDLYESPGGTFGAFLYNSASGGPVWDDVISPIASMAVGMGILIPGKFAYEEIPELVIPAFEQWYADHNVDENAECTAD